MIRILINSLFLVGVALALCNPQRGWALPDTGARFPDWKDMGCRMAPQPAGAPASEADNASGNQANCRNCPPDHGIPRWWINQPWQNLHVSDSPVSYFQSSGQETAFRFLYKQRYMLPQPDECTNFYYIATVPNTPRSQDDHYITDLRTYGMTNASWAHNWLLDITFWD